MNSALSNEAFDSDAGIKSIFYNVRFNQDVTCVALGTPRGFSIYNIDPIQVLLMLI